jgi:hypothetical protein
MDKTTNLIIGITILVIGAFYTFISHSIHISSGLDFGFVHSVHVTVGIVFLVAGGFLLWKKK